MNPYRVGQAVFWVRYPAFAPGSVQLATVARVKGEHVTIRLTDGRQRTTLAKMLAFSGHCPRCKVPAIVAAGQRVCPACGGPAEALPPLDLAHQWLGAYHLRSAIIDTLMKPREASSAR